MPVIHGSHIGDTTARGPSNYTYAVQATICAFKHATADMVCNTYMWSITTGMALSCTNTSPEVPSLSTPSRLSPEVLRMPCSLHPCFPVVTAAFVVKRNLYLPCTTSSARRGLARSFNRVLLDWLELLKMIFEVYIMIVRRLICFRRQTSRAAVFR